MESGWGWLHFTLATGAFRRGSLVPVETPTWTCPAVLLICINKDQTSAMREFLELCRAFTAGVQRSDEIVLPNIA